MNFFYNFITSCVILSQASYAQTPVLSSSETQSIPVGYKWSKKDSMSDEFNSPKGEKPYDSTAALDRAKWNPSLVDWKGRKPAEFYPDNVYLEGDQMHIKNTPHPFPHDGYTIAGGAVESVNTQKYGYFEVRMKASKIRMSSTFWLNTTTVAFDDAVKNPDRSEGCEGYSTEIDIVECMGSIDTTPDWMHAAPWDVAMASNTHFKLKELVDVERADKTVIKQCQDVYYSTPASTFISTDKTSNVADDFHVYAAWWVNSNTVHYYLDGVKVKTLHPNDISLTTPFNVPMSIRMVTETYDWQNTKNPDTGVVSPTPGYPDPTDTNPLAELNNSLINTTHYDWIHTYELKPINENLVDNPDFESEGLDASNWTYWQPSGTKHIYISGEAGEKYTNNNGVKIEDLGGLEQVINVVPNTDYVYTVFAKKIKGKLILGVKEVDANVNIAEDAQVFGDVFEEYKIEFNSGDRSRVKLFAFCNNGDVGVLDNFSVINKSKFDEIKLGTTLNHQVFESSEKEVSVVVKNKTIQLYTNVPKVIDRVEIYSFIGSKIYEATDIGLSSKTIKTTINSGVYILKIKLKGGRVSTQKIHVM